MTASAAASTAIRTIARERITWSLYGGLKEGPPPGERARCALGGQASGAVGFVGCSVTSGAMVTRTALAPAVAVTARGLT